jgi:hypothetical protein
VECCSFAWKMVEVQYWKALLRACVYQLWKQRNALIHGKIPKSWEAIIMQINVQFVST